MKLGVQAGFAVSDIFRSSAIFQGVDFCLVSIVVTADNM